MIIIVNAVFSLFVLISLGYMVSLSIKGKEISPIHSWITIFASSFLLVSSVYGIVSSL